MSVIVTMPYYKVGPLLRRAVESILNQTYQDWRLIIVNDADPEPPWQYIDDLNDPRIVRFDLKENRGRYFADAVIFEACQPEWWALADPDDVSYPKRFERMLDVAQDTGVAFGPWKIHRINGTSYVSDKGLWEKPARYKVKYLGGYGPGLISGKRIRRAGGFHPGYRVAYDNLLLNLIRLTGPVSVTDEVMGAKFFRANSLTTSRRTGMRSSYRRRVHADRLALWQKAWDHYHKHGEVASVIRADIPRGLWREVQVQAARLRRLL